MNQGQAGKVLDTAEGMPIRDRYWNELGFEEKLNALREVIVHQQQMIYRAMDLIGSLERHSHDSSGYVSIRLQDVRNSVNGLGLKDDRVPYPLRIDPAIKPNG